MSNLMLDVDQAGELKAAFRRGKWTNEEIKKSCEGDFLLKVREVLLGRAEIKPIEHLVDLGADPFVPEGWSVEEHLKGKIVKPERKGNDLYLDGKKSKLWLSNEQKHGPIIGKILQTRLKSQLVLNTNLLDYLLKHTHLIPETWKKDKNGEIQYIFFWGTRYRNDDDDLCVRFLYWDGITWDWNYQ